jgi:short-subunit dehydrogenase
MKILVTGCSSGLGRELIYNEKHEMFAHFRKLEKPSVNQLVGDINDEIFIENFRNFLSLHSINVLVNNVAIYDKQPVTEMTRSEVALAINTNLLAPILLTQAAITHFKELGGGLIVNINSLAGKQGSPGESIYTASKFGLRGFSNAIRYEVKDFGIHILDVYLGGMRTRMTKNRSDQDTLIDPNEAAVAILKIVDDYKSLNITELEIRKK